MKTQVLAAPATLAAAGPGLLVALDVDGTLVHEDGSCSPAVEGAVDAVAGTGTHVVIATGRGWLAMKDVLATLRIERGWAVLSNGAMTVELDPDLQDGMRVESVHTFDPAETLYRLRDAVPGALLMVEDAECSRRTTGAFPPGEVAGDPDVVPFEALLEIPAARVTLRAPHLTPQELADRVDGAGLNSVSYAIGWSAWLDVAPAGVSKASALEVLRERLGVAPSSTVAVGDGENDHEMLQWAAWGVAMGQAAPVTRAHAAVVTGPIWEDGAARVLDALLAER